MIKNYSLFIYLFIALSSFVLENHTMSRAAELRSLAADIIASDPFTYNETFLGRPNKDYCEWIRKKNSWGGQLIN